METDKRYFFEGLFIIVFASAAALFFVWLSNSGRSDDVVYRMHFAESVSGLAVGDPVKFHGVDVGTVKSLQIDDNDQRLVQVDVKLRKDTPVKSDTRAVLKFKGITGVMFIELTGGGEKSKSLVASTPAGQMPEIPVEKSVIAELLDQLPKVVAKFSGIEDKVNKVATDVGDLTGKLHDKFIPDKKKAKPAPGEPQQPSN
jgi:phospholipid/cholesterol/gamma-HCH transport system substrate-binding protein